jgi:hypothetical protein
MAKKLAIQHGDGVCVHSFSTSRYAPVSSQIGEAMAKDFLEEKGRGGNEEV